MVDKRDDDIIDLTEDKGAEGKKKNKMKKEKDKDKNKEPGLPAAAQANVEKPGKKGKPKVVKKRGGKLKLILIIVPVVLVAGFVTALALNLFEVRSMVGTLVKEPILRAVVWFDPEFSSVDEELRFKSSEREAELDLRGTQLDRREEGIAERETELEFLEESLDKRELQLERRSASLDSREEQIKQTNNAAVPVYRNILSEQELADMQSLSRSYAQMAPETAAEILAELKDEKDVATILYYMGERNAAAILAVMETEFAARVTKILMSGQ